MRRSLSLKRETLTDLTAAELTGVAGGATQLCPTRQPTLCYLCALTPGLTDLTVICA